MPRVGRHRSFVPASDPTVSLVSNERLFREGIIELLHREGFHHITEFGDSSTLCANAATRQPDVVVVDLDHEDEDTMAVLRALRRDLPDTHLVAIGSPLRQAALNSTIDAPVETPAAGRDDLAAAARGQVYLLSGTAIRALQQWHDVSPRQRDVMRWLAIGLDNAAIARKLRTGIRAVKTHITKLLEHFQLDNRTQLALLADHAGLRPPRTRGGPSSRMSASH